jgi:DNA polymerase-3 subunit gamma/tau
MSQALYRKWRPTRFEEVVGQDHVSRTLQNAIAADRIGHAYLFSGPRGTGKTTSARLLAKAANCLAEDLGQRPCNVCQHCLAVNQGRFLDLIEIDAASNTGVDDIRDLRDKISFSPSEGRYKVYIIDEVHMLSIAAFNALLKTLEEPPAHAILILATTEEHKVPLTIKSRCQQFTFRLLTTKEIINRLSWLVEQEQLTVEEEAMLMIAQHGAGSLRDAESLLDQLVAAPGDVISLERAQTVLGTAPEETVRNLTNAWINGDGGLGLSIIHSALSSGTDARQFARQMVTYLRQLLLLQTAGRDLDLDVTPEQREALNQQTGQIGREQIIEALKHFNEAATTLSRNWQPNLPLELAFIEVLPSTSSDYLPAENAKDQSNGEDVSIKPLSPASEVIKDVSLTSESSPDSERVEGQNQPKSDQKLAPETLNANGISLSDVTGIWPRLRESIGKRDKKLQALLAASKPLALEGNVLILGFDYPILKDKFDGKAQASENIADSLSTLLGTKCLVRTVVTENYTINAAETAVKREDFEALANELGGVVSSGDN